MAARASYQRKDVIELVLPKFQTDVKIRDTHVFLTIPLSVAPSIIFALREAMKDAGSVDV